MVGEEERHQMMQNLIDDQSEEEEEEEEEIESEHKSNRQPDYASEPEENQSGCNCSCRNAEDGVSPITGAVLARPQ